MSTTTTQEQKIGGNNDCWWRVNWVWTADATKCTLNGIYVHRWDRYDIASGSGEYYETLSGCDSNNGSWGWYTSSSTGAGYHLEDSFGTRTITRGHSTKIVKLVIKTNYWWATNSEYTGWNRIGETTTTFTFNVDPLSSYTVTYNANGGSGAPGAQTKWYGESLTLSSTKPIRTNYTFLHWNTKSDGTGTSYNAGAAYTANAAVTLYAIWQYNGYTISYAANGGSSTPAAQTKYVNTALTLRGAISRANASAGSRTVSFNINYSGGTNPSSLTSTGTTKYTFTGWKFSYNSQTYAGGGTLPANVNGAGTMTAQWSSATTWTAVTLPTPTRSGYVFRRWNTSTADTGTAANAGASYTPSANTTFYAIWNPVITYNANGGSGAPSALTKTFNAAATLSTTKPTKTGFVFSHWNTNQQNTGTRYEAGGSVAANMNTSTTLYAFYGNPVTYNANGGSGAPAAQTKLEGVNLTLSTSVPTRTNYVFKNWDTDPDADPFDTSDTSYEKGDTYSADAPLALYAIWYPPNTVSYNSNGGAGTPSAQTKIYGNNISLSVSVPTRFGYRFEGWNTEPDGSGTDYASGSTYSANADVTMYAVWSPIVSAVNIGTATVIRVETAQSTTEDDDGEYGYITVPFVVTGAASASVSISITGEADGLYPDPSITYLDGPFTKQSGVDNVLSGTFHAVASVCDVECKYDFSITVTAHNTEVDVTQTDVSNIAGCIMPIAYLTMDVKAGGHGISFGAPALDDSFNVSMPFKYYKEQTYFTFERSSWDENSDQTTLPKTPCFVFDSSSYKAYWCDGIDILPMGYLPLSGGALTGELTVAGNNLYIRSNEIDRDGSNPSGNTYGRSFFHLDKDNERIGLFQPMRDANGTEWVRITATNEVSGSNSDNNIYIGVKSDGTKVYSVGDQAAFRSAISAPACTEENGYYGLKRPDGNTSAYLRAPSSGFIPYQSGGSGNLGTSSWPWNNIYGKNIYLNGTALGSLATKSSLAASDIPNLAASKINSGTFDAARLPNHSAGLLTSGTLPNARLSDGGWVKLNNNVYYRIRAGFCSVIGDGLGSKTVSSSGTDVGTLPSGARPTRAQEGSGTSTTNNCVQWSVNTSGVVRVWRWGGDNGYWVFVATYPI